MDRHQDVTALLANRLKPLSRVAPRDSFASDSYSIEDSPVPLHYAEDDTRSSKSRNQTTHHPFSAQTRYDDDEDTDTQDADDSQETQLRMSVLGPKIHKNGNAPWEEMDGLAEEPEEYDRPSTPAASIFGKRSKHSRKGSTSTTSGLRQRSKTVVEALASPVGALKGLGFGVGVGGGQASANSAPASGRTSRNNSFAPSLSRQPRPSFQSQSSSSAAHDDDRRSVNTVVDGYPSSRQRSRSRPPLPDTAKTKTTSTYADGTIPIDLTGRNSAFSASSRSSSLSDDDSPASRYPPPLPRTSKSPLRIATNVVNNHHSHTDSIVRPEDVFRTSVVSNSSDYGQRLHPYSNPGDRDVRTTSHSPISPAAPSAFSADWASSSPSLIDGSRSRDDSSSPDSWLDSPSGLGRSAASSGYFDQPRNGSASLSSRTINQNNVKPATSPAARKRPPPPPLSLHPSTSSTSISTLAKAGGSTSLIPPPPLPTTPLSTSSGSGTTRSHTPNSEALYKSEEIANTKPLNISRKAAPQYPSPTEASDHLKPSMATESSLPFPSAPHLQQSPSQTSEDVPPGMLVFPGSPAYGLISLEQAQAKARGGGLAGRTLSGDANPKGKKDGIGGFVARMRLGSEDKSGSAAATETPCASAVPEKGQAQPTRTPVLRQRKSGFLKIFGGGDKGAVPPMPTSPIPRTPGTMISSPVPVAFTDDGLPSPFLPADAGTRKPMVLKDLVPRQSSLSTASIPSTRQSSASSSSPPQSLQSRPSVASSFSKLRVGEEELGYARERSGTESTVHSPQYELVVGPKDESIRSDLSTMGGGEDDAAGEERRMMLKLRHVSATNFLSSLPSGYLSRPYTEKDSPNAHATPSSTSTSTLNNSIPYSSTASEYTFSASNSVVSRPSVSASSDGPPATPSYNSLLSSSSSNWVSSSAYASSESSSSIAPSPLPITPHSGSMAHQQQISMMSLVSPTPTQSSFLSSPGRTPQQQQPFLDHPGVSVSSVVTSLQEELAAARKQMRQQAAEMERMRAELDALKKEQGVCRGCGGRDALLVRSNSSESEAGEGRPAGVVNRPRAPTGSGGRFGSRMV